jgi:hypothetical protein
VIVSPETGEGAGYYVRAGEVVPVELA